MTDIDWKARAEAAEARVRGLEAHSYLAKANIDQIAEFIGRSLASFVSGNNMPDMSGDPRNRIGPGRREYYDLACRKTAAILLSKLKSARLTVTDEMVCEFIRVSNDETAGYTCWSDAVRDALTAALEGKK